MVFFGRPTAPPLGLRCFCATALGLAALPLRARSRTRAHRLKCPPPIPCATCPALQLCVSLHAFPPSLDCVLPRDVVVLTGLIDNDVASADVGEDFRSTFEVDSVLVIVADEDMHVLALAREREHLHYLSIVTSFLVWHPAQLPRKAQESCLRLRAHKVEFASLAIGILKCSGVDRDSFVEQVLQGWREYIIKVGLLDGKVVGMLALLLSVGFVGVGPGEVLLQVLDDSFASSSHLREHQWRLRLPDHC